MVFPSSSRQRERHALAACLVVGWTSVPVAPQSQASRGRVIGLSLRFDESLSFVVVHVLRTVSNRAAHLQKPRANTLQAPRAHREP
jgi:hypothetical protein